MAEGGRPDMILVMGVTGAGKSYFCNSVAGREVAREGNGLSSCELPPLESYDELLLQVTLRKADSAASGTTGCQAVIVSAGGTKVMLVDTPGFDDPNKSDSQILKQISTVLAVQYKLGFNLKGVIYLYRISDIRHTGGASSALSLFTKICGDHAFKNVVLTTTRWELVPETTGSQREKELQQGFWKHMLTLDASMARYKGDRASALVIVSQVLKVAGKTAVVLELQREMVEENKALKDTSAGSFVNDDLRAVRAKYEEELAALEDLKDHLDNADRRKMQSTVDGIESEKVKVASVRRDQEELARKIAQEVEDEIHGETTKSKRNRSSVAAMVSAAVGVLGLFFNLGPEVKSELTQWFSDHSLSDFISNFFSS